MDTETVLTKEHIRMFARRQRRYILAYLALENAKTNDNQPGDENDEAAGRPQIHLPEISCRLIERVVKVYKAPHKCHRCTMDQEFKFLNSVNNENESKYINEIVRWMKKINVESK